MPFVSRPEATDRPATGDSAAVRPSPNVATFLKFEANLGTLYSRSSLAEFLAAERVMPGSDSLPPFLWLETEWRLETDCESNTHLLYNFCDMTRQVLERRYLGRAFLRPRDGGRLLVNSLQPPTAAE